MTISFILESKQFPDGFLLVEFSQTPIYFIALLQKAIKSIFFSVYNFSAFRLPTSSIVLFTEFLFYIRPDKYAHSIPLLNAPLSNSSDSQINKHSTLITTHYFDTQLDSFLGLNPVI
mmetsp:Transcript_31260/g.42706  ORF Transcript_31260/g.42706 Transcript_31260/m.42706 type:complete len:117 (+) Transcript_31260:2831-3181(+)